MKISFPVGSLQHIHVVFNVLGWECVLNEEGSLNSNY